MKILQAFFPHCVSVPVTFSITYSILFPFSVLRFYTDKSWGYFTFLITTTAHTNAKRRKTHTFHIRIRYRTRSVKSFLSMSVSSWRRWSMRRYIIRVLCQKSLQVNRHTILKVATTLDFIRCVSCLKFWHNLYFEPTGFLRRASPHSLHARSPGRFQKVSLPPSSSTTWLLLASSGSQQSPSLFLPLAGGFQLSVLTPKEELGDTLLSK